MPRGIDSARDPSRQADSYRPDLTVSRAQQQTRQAGHIPTQRVAGEEIPRRVWKGHPSERPEGWLQAELPT